MLSRRDNWEIKDISIVISHLTFIRHYGKHCGKSSSKTKIIPSNTTQVSSCVVLYATLSLKSGGCTGSFIMHLQHCFSVVVLCFGSVRETWGELLRGVLAPRTHDVNVFHGGAINMSSLCMHRKIHPGRVIAAVSKGNCLQLVSTYSSFYQISLSEKVMGYANEAS